MKWIIGGLILLVIVAIVVARRQPPRRVALPDRDPAQTWLTGTTGDKSDPENDDPAEGGGPDTANGSGEND